MADKKFGTKRFCSNCETKFYDLNKKSPLTCPHCKSEMTIEEDFVYAQPAQVAQPSKPEAEKSPSKRRHTRHALPGSS